MLTTQDAPDGGAAWAGTAKPSEPRASAEAAARAAAERKIAELFIRYLFRPFASLRRVCSSLN